MSQKVTYSNKNTILIASEPSKAMRKHAEARMTQLTRPSQKILKALAGISLHSR